MFNNTFSYLWTVKTLRKRIGKAHLIQYLFRGVHLKYNSTPTKSDHYRQGYIPNPYPSTDSYPQFAKTPSKAHQRIPFLLFRLALPLPLCTTRASPRRPSPFLRLCTTTLPPSIRCLDLIQLSLHHGFEICVASREEHDVVGVDDLAAGVLGEDFEVAGGVGWGGWLMEVGRVGCGEMYLVACTQVLSRRR